MLQFILDIYGVIVINNMSKTYFKMTTKILIFKFKKIIFNSNKKRKLKCQYLDSNSHHSVDQFRYRISVTLYPLCHFLKWYWYAVHQLRYPPCDAAHRSGAMVHVTWISLLEGVVTYLCFYLKKKILHCDYSKCK